MEKNIEKAIKVAVLVATALISASKGASAVGTFAKTAIEIFQVFKSCSGSYSRINLGIGGNYAV